MMALDLQSLNELDEVDTKKGLKLNVAAPFLYRRMVKLLLNDPS